MISIVVLDTLIWSLWNINQKKAAQELTGKEPLVMHLYFVPIGIIAFLIFAYFGGPLTNNLSMYLLYLILFPFLVLVEMIFTYKVYKDLNTSGFFKLKTGVGLLISAIFDYFFFGTFPSILVLISVSLMVLSGYLLGGSEEGKGQQFNMKIFGGIFMVALFGTVGSLLLKKYAEISLNDFANIFSLELLTQIVVGLGGYGYIRSVIKNKKLKKFKFSFAFIIFFGIMTQFFVHKQLSLFLIVAILNLRFIIYLVFDYFNGELNLNKKKIAGIIFGIIGAIVLGIRQFM